MSKHTPGPWLACAHGDYSDYDGNCIVVLGDGGSIRTAVVLGFNTDENRANAHLIAAAPDLLEAAKLVIAWYEAEDDNSKTDFYERQRMCRDSEDALRAAIAKATGDSK